MSFKEKAPLSKGDTVNHLNVLCSVSGTATQKKTCAKLASRQIRQRDQRRWQGRQGLHLSIRRQRHMGVTACHWGWVPAVIVRKEEASIVDVVLMNLTLVNDRTIEGHPSNYKALHR